MTQATTVAIRQGYPDKVYKYRNESEYIDEIRQKAEDSGGMTDLRDELAMLRDQAQQLVTMFDGNETLTEGYDKDGNPKSMTDATKIKLMAQLMTAIGKLTRDNLAVTEDDYVHVDQVNVWFAGVIRILQHALEAEQGELFTKIIASIKEVPTMKSGRIK